MAKKRTKTSANTIKKLRPLKKGETIAYGGAGFHIQKPKKKKK